MHEQSQMKKRAIKKNENFEFKHLSGCCLSIGIYAIVLSKISPIVWRNDKWYWQICSEQSSSLRYLNLFSYYFLHEVLSDIKMHCNEFICLCHTQYTQYKRNFVALKKKSMLEIVLCIVHMVRRMRVVYSPVIRFIYSKSHQKYTDCTLTLVKVN